MRKRIKRKIKGEGLIKEKKGKIKNMEYLLVFYEFINFLWFNLGSNFI